jgi:hypothetical protein
MLQVLYHLFHVKHLLQHEVLYDYIELIRCNFRVIVLSLSIYLYTLSKIAKYSSSYVIDRLIPTLTSAWWSSFTSNQLFPPTSAYLNIRSMSSSSYVFGRCVGTSSSSSSSGFSLTRISSSGIYSAFAKSQSVDTSSTNRNILNTYFSSSWRSFSNCSVIYLITGYITLVNT